MPTRPLRESAPRKRASEKASFYIWTVVVLAVAVTAVVLGWHASGGTSPLSTCA